jgi:hypothetical protein
MAATATAATILARLRDTEQTLAATRPVRPLSAFDLFAQSLKQ